MKTDLNYFSGHAKIHFPNLTEKCAEHNVSYWLKYAKQRRLRKEELSNFLYYVIYRYIYRKYFFSSGDHFNKV